MQKKLLLIVTALGAMTLAACDQGITSGIVADPLNATMIADFSEGESEEIYPSNGWSNGGGFNAVWTSDNVTYSDGKMKLSIQDKEAEADGVKYPHTAGEARTHKLYGYGDYEVRMKPTNVVGSVSTFFTYTDQWNKVDGVENKHDEIDIEFLGKDTTKVQFNYFVGGQGGHEHMHNLGFDASQEFHNYGFRWAEKSITWFVDGVPVYQINKDNPAELPSQNGRMMASYWPSSISSWSGTYEGPSDKTCEYEWIKSSGDTIYADGEAPVPSFDNNINWDSISETDLEFGADPTDTGYTVTKVDGVTTIAYDQPKAWKNVQAEAVDVVNSNDAVSLVLKNNSATESTIRVDIQGENKVGNRDALNEMAIAYDTDAEVSTDPEWGGSTLTLKANEETRLIIKYDVTTDRGLAKNILIFADSLSENPAAHQGGNIRVKDIKFGSTTGTPIVPPTPGPVDPEPGDLPYDDTVVVPAISDDAVALSFWSSDATNYPVVSGDSGKSVSVTYSDIAAYAYKCIGAESLAGITDLASVNQVKVTVTNKGLKSANFRIDTKSADGVHLQSGAAIAGEEGDYSGLDFSGEGTKFVVAAKKSVVVTIDLSGAATLGEYIFFLDSIGSSATSGKIVLSSFEFIAGEHQVEDLNLTFTGGEGYTDLVTNTPVKSLTVSYTDLVGNGYANFESDVSGVTGLADNNIFKFKIVNNGENMAKIRIDTLSGDTHIHTNILTANDWGAWIQGEGSVVQVGNGQTVQVGITFDQAAGEKPLTKLVFFVDSCNDSADTKTGEVVLSDFEFDTVYDWTKVSKVDATFTTEASSVYSIEKEDGVSTITYTDAKDWANLNTNLAEVEGDYNAVQLRFRNKTSTTASIRIDLKDPSWSDTNLEVVAEVFGRPEIIANANGETTITLYDSQMMDITFHYTGDLGFVLLFVDSMQGEAHSGQIAIESVKLGNIALLI